MTDYRKGADKALDNEFSAALPYGNIRLGSSCIFARRMLRWKYIPYSRVKQAWRRIEEAKGRTGCCSNDFSSHFLMLLTVEGETLKLKIGDEMYRHEPEALIEKLRELQPGIVIALPEQS